MNIVEDIAIEFVENKYSDSKNLTEFMDLLESEMLRHRKESDKLRFLSSVKNEIQNIYDKHIKECTNATNCIILKDALKCIYYINGIFYEYGISSNVDQIISEKEKIEYSLKLDKVLEELTELKNGHELIYNDLYDELQELKKMYFLGKKNWKQLLAGKTIDMVAGGVISEVVSKELIEITEMATSSLLSN